MLRQQINVLRRTAPKKQTFSAIDRLIFVCLCRPGVRDALAIVKPETVVKWHRAGLPIILALEIEIAGWQANASVRDTPADPRDEHCQSAVGSASDPWRTPQARRRYRTEQRGQVHGQATRPAVPRLEKVSPQSCRRHRCDGYVRRADNFVSPALWIADHEAPPATYSVVWRHSKSNRRMDRKSGHGSMRVGTGSPAISFVTGTGLMVRSLSADSDR
jgi:hypothetical protein